MITRAAANYLDAETRGRLRTWKQELVQGYQRLPYGDEKLMEDIVAFCQRGSDTGRQRAFRRVAQRMKAAGATLEGVRYGKYPMAVWAMLVARTPVAVNADQTQGCVTLNYVLAGGLPHIGPGLADGLWSLEITDHALGRAMQRHQVAAPAAIVLDAHHTILKLRTEMVLPNRRLNTDQQFLVRAGFGGFVCSLKAGLDVSLKGGSHTVHATAVTWLADDMVYDDQIILADDGVIGERLGDSLLMPPPVRTLTRTGDELHREVWAPGLPETLAAPKGRA